MPRIPITKEMISAGWDSIWNWYKEKITQKGNDSFISMHEAHIAILEEYDEARAAVHTGDRSWLRRELLDVAVPCLFEIAALEATKVTVRLDRLPLVGRLIKEQFEYVKDNYSLFSETAAPLTQASLHEVLAPTFSAYHRLESFAGSIPLDYIENAHSRWKEAIDALAELVCACLHGIISIDAGQLDW